jgi:eukaryotic-like serine/threonine-protein kinase
MTTASWQQSFPKNPRFEAARRLGHGGFGIVFEARDRSWNQVVALKVLREHRHRELARFKREFRNFADVRHPNLVGLHQLFVDDDATYFTMELVRGRDFVSAFRVGACRSRNIPEAATGFMTAGTPLRDTLDIVEPDLRAVPAPGLIPLDQPTSLRLAAAVRQLTDGLHHLHRIGWVHRDVKPSNLIVTEDDRVVVLDFGLTDDLGVPHAGQQRAGLALGTPGYVAPEQLAGEALSTASDWWAVGVVLAETLAGHADRVELARTLDSVLKDDAPRECCGLFALAIELLEPDPQMRASRDEILRRLDDIAGIGHGTRLRSAPLKPVPVPFVGRARELGMLQRALEDLLAARGSWIRIRGAAGVGKSALIAEFARRSRGRDVWLFSTICRDREFVPFRGVDALMDQLGAALRSEPTIAAELSAVDNAHALATIFKALPCEPQADGPPLAHAEEMVERRRTVFTAWRDAMVRIAIKRPIVLAIDDAQWGDADSALLLSNLMERDAPILVIIANRSEATGPFLVGIDAGLRACGRTWNDIELDALNTSEARALVSQLLGPSAPSADRMDSLVQQASGLPIFLVTLATSLEDGSSSESFDQVLVRRLSMLPPVATALIESTAISPAPVREDVLLSSVEGMGLAQEWLIALDVERLLLRLPSSSGNLLEPYHDRIREAVLGMADPMARRLRHLQLAAAIQLHEGSDARPEILFVHYAGAGENETASQHGERAADRAARALAFDRASSLYLEAANLTNDALRKCSLTERHGDAMVASGQTAAGAAVYEALALSPAAMARGAILHKAAEAYLITGYHTEGLRIWRQLARDLGLRFPRSSFSTVVGAIIALMRARIRWWDGSAKPGRAAIEEARADAALAAAKGLIAIDPMRGTYFGLQSLSHARNARRADSLVMSLAFVAAACLAAAGGTLRRWAISLLDEAHRLSATDPSGYLQAIVTVARAQIALFQGRWAEAADSARVGLATLSTAGHARTWETNMANQARGRGLEEIGEFAALNREAQAWRTHSEQRGDAFGSVTALLTLGACSLGTGDIGDAERYASEADDCWGTPGYTVQRFYASRIRILAALQRGELPVAERLLHEELRRVRSSMIFRVPTGRIDTLWMESRIALARVTAGGPRSAASLSLLDHNAHRLGREDHAPARAHARFIRGIVANVRGIHAGAQEDLAAACSLYEQTGMAPMCALVELYLASCSRSKPLEPILGRLAAMGIKDTSAWVRGHGMIL